jgi:hypothetical protein
MVGMAEFGSRRREGGEDAKREDHERDDAKHGGHESSGAI